MSDFTESPAGNGQNQTSPQHHATVNPSHPRCLCGKSTRAAVRANRGSVRMPGCFGALVRVRPAKHDALLDAELLAAAYVELTTTRQAALQLEPLASGPS
jgi:hypothetical protein